MKHIFALVKQRHILVSIYYVLAMPFSIMAILNSDRIHPAYRITWWKKLSLGVRFFLNGIRIQTGTTASGHIFIDEVTGTDYCARMIGIIQHQCHIA